VQASAVFNKALAAVKKAEEEMGRNREEVDVRSWLAIASTYAEIAQELAWVERGNK
jgi:hypothetical protein